METKQHDIKRDVAIKLSISNIKNSEYVKDDNNSLNYIKTTNGNISRINIIGIVVSKEISPNVGTIVIDDSTSSITIRNFDSSNKLDNIQIGNIVIVIGRLRIYENEKYIIPEIIRPLRNKNWLILRKKELEIKNDTPLSKVIKTYPEQKIIKKEQIKTEPQNIKQELPSKKPNADISNPYEKILNLVKSLDTGFGVSFEEIIMNSGINNCEEVIQNLIEEGEIFEVRPGILKVL